MRQDVLETLAAARRQQRAAGEAAHPGQVGPRQELAGGHLAPAAVVIDPGPRHAGLATRKRGAADPEPGCPGAPHPDRRAELVEGAGEIARLTQQDGPRHRHPRAIQPLLGGGLVVAQRHHAGGGERRAEARGQPAGVAQLAHRPDLDRVGRHDGDRALARGHLGQRRRVALALARERDAIGRVAQGQRQVPAVGVGADQLQHLTARGAAHPPERAGHVGAQRSSGAGHDHRAHALLSAGGV